MLPIDELLEKHVVSFTSEYYLSYYIKNFFRTRKLSYILYSPKFSWVFNPQNIFNVHHSEHTHFHVLTARASMKNIPGLSCRSARKSLQRNTFKVGIGLLTDVSSSERQCDGTCLVVRARPTSKVVTLTPTLPFSCRTGSGLRD